MVCLVPTFPFTQPSHASYRVPLPPRPLPTSSVACRDERSDTACCAHFAFSAFCVSDQAAGSGF